MAGTIQSFVPAAWDARIDTLDPKSLIKIALEGALAVNGNPTAADGTLAVLCAKRLGNDCDFEIAARSTIAESVPIELIARGVTFPAGSNRVIEVEVFASGEAANEIQYFRHTGFVTGGTTPVVNVVTLPATGPLQVPGNTLISAAAGFAGNSITLVAGVGTLTLNLISTEAEIVNWFARIKVGRLTAFTAGV